MPFLIYYFSYALQTLIPDIKYLTLIISFFILYDQIIKKKDNIFKIFLVFLPSLYFFKFNDQKLEISVYFFMNFDPVLIGSLLFLYRNCLLIRLDRISGTFLLYLILLIYTSIHLVILNLTGQTSSQGLSFSFRAILYAGIFFSFYNNDFNDFKNQILKVIILSVILVYFREIINYSFENFKISTHIIFLAFAFPAIIIFYRINILNVCLYIPSIFIIKYQSFTIIGIFLLSHLLILFRKTRIIFNSFNLIFLINFQVIVLISILFIDYFTLNYDENNLFYKKFLLDRIPLYIASVESLDYFNFGASFLTITNDNMILNSTHINKWDYGSHNYFLNIATKLGLVPAIVLMLLINIFFIKLYKEINKSLYLKNKFIVLLFLSLVASFAVFSTTGNAFSENLGAFFFLTLGSLYSIVMTKKKEVK